MVRTGGLPLVHFIEWVFSAMASLTKNQLINELINHGVKPPASGAKKEKLVEMYEEHVSHFQEAAGEFSSDDEAEKRVNGEEVGTLG